MRRRGAPDWEVAHRIRSALSAQRPLAACRIHIAVVGCRARLYGQVRSLAQFTQAALAASGVDGVLQLRNDLVVLDCPRDAG